MGLGSHMLPLIRQSGRKTVLQKERSRGSNPARFETCECTPQSLLSIKPIVNKRVPGRHRSAQHSVTLKQPGKPQRYGHRGEPVTLAKWELKEKHGLSPEVQGQSRKQQEGCKAGGTHSGRNSTIGLHLSLLPTTHH